MATITMLVVGKCLVDLLPDLFGNEPDPLTPELDWVLDEDRIPTKTRQAHALPLSFE